jgi:uncharacterized protein (DUF2164 family)
VAKGVIKQEGEGKMAKNNALSVFGLSTEEKKKLLEEIQSYFEQERDEKIGIIAAEDLLEFFLNALGKQIYNKALDNVKLWYEKVMENVEADFYALYKN